MCLETDFRIVERFRHSTWARDILRANRRHPRQQRVVSEQALDMGGMVDAMNDSHPAASGLCAAENEVV